MSPKQLAPPDMVTTPPRLALALSSASHCSIYLPSDLYSSLYSILPLFHYCLYSTTSLPLPAPFASRRRRSFSNPSAVCLPSRGWFDRFTPPPSSLHERHLFSLSPFSPVSALTPRRAAFLHPRSSSEST